MIRKLGLALNAALARLGFGDRQFGSNVVGVRNDDSRMKAAVVDARASVDSFIEAIQSPGPGQSGFTIKAAIAAGSDTEHIWLDNVRYDGEFFQGGLDSQPTLAAGFKRGDRLKVRPNDISD
jgi:uncharacterized protein YegJ (DUF2314 family)